MISLLASLYGVSFLDSLTQSSMLNNENIIFLLLLNCKACKLKILYDSSCTWLIILRHVPVPLQLLSRGPLGQCASNQARDAIHQAILLRLSRPVHVFGDISMNNTTILMFSQISSLSRVFLFLKAHTNFCSWHMLLYDR